MPAPQMTTSATSGMDAPTSLHEVSLVPRSQCGWCSDRQLQKRSEEHTSELQSPCNLVCRLLLEKKKKKTFIHRLTTTYDQTYSSFVLIAHLEYHNYSQSYQSFINIV